MTQTSSNLPVCIHCGTPRPADETQCPSCGKPWIDILVADVPPVVPESEAPASEPGGVAAAATATAELVTDEDLQLDDEPLAVETPLPPHDTGEFGLDEWTLPPEPPKKRPLWLIPVGLVLAVMGFWAYVYYADTGTSTTTVVAEASTSTSAAPSTTTTVAALSDESTTTTAPPTTTTTLPYPSAAAWEESGEGISTALLKMKASGLGSIDIGSSLADVSGQLVASLGPAESAGVADLCPPEEAYWLRWGPLTAVFDGWEPDSAFVGYRYSEINAGETNVPLTTLSGLRLGDTVADLQTTYSFYTVTFEVIEGQDHFRLVDGGELLLWGPVSSTDSTGTILGIYSPSPCPAS